MSTKDLLINNIKELVLNISKLLDQEVNVVDKELFLNPIRVKQDNIKFCSSVERIEINDIGEIDVMLKYCNCNDGMIYFSHIYEFSVEDLATISDELEKVNEHFITYHKYIVKYYSPKEYRGTYLVEAKDDFEASEKVSKYLEENFGKVKDSHSMIIDVDNDKLVLI